DGGFIHRALEVLLEWANRAALPLLPQRGPLLEDQAVAREMRRSEADRDLQVAAPVFQRRAGHAEDQVERPAREPGPDDLDRLLALEGRQVAIRQVIDAGQGREVAIAALVGTEGDMNVSGAGPLPPRLGIARDGVPNHGTASTKRISGTPALRVDSTLILRVK